MICKPLLTYPRVTLGGLGKSLWVWTLLVLGGTSAS